MSVSQCLAAFILLAGLVPGVLAQKSSTKGTAQTSFYWDCCKASCSWADHGFFVGNPIAVCGANGTRLTDWNLGTGCSDGESFSCQDQIPWAVNDTFSYGFMGAYIDGYLERTWCCGCYELEFTDTAIKGKKMVVQASNSNYDAVGYSQFNIGIPGGYDYASACRKQFGATEVNGKDNNGVLTRDQCDLLPETLRKGCQWRFDWFLDAKRPNVTWKRTVCPTELTEISGCLREDEAGFITSATTNDTVAPPPSAATTVGAFPAFYSIAFAILLGLAVSL
ncbi:Endoglucanase-5 [Dactylella cylindrospora]|nr:Endoglucanase-5 [Dactylella cylindrospora]